MRREYLFEKVEMLVSIIRYQNNWQSLSVFLSEIRHVPEHRFVPWHTMVVLL